MRMIPSNGPLAVFLVMFSPFPPFRGGRTFANSQLLWLPPHLPHNHNLPLASNKVSPSKLPGNGTTPLQQPCLSDSLEDRIPRTRRRRSSRRRRRPRPWRLRRRRRRLAGSAWAGRTATPTPRRRRRKGRPRGQVRNYALVVASRGGLGVEGRA